LRLANAAVIGNGSLPKSGIEGVNVNRINSGDTPGGVNGSTRATDTGTVEGTGGTGTASNLDDNQPAARGGSIEIIESPERAEEIRGILNTVANNPEDIEKQGNLLESFVKYEADELIKDIAPKQINKRNAFAIASIPTRKNSLTQSRTNFVGTPNSWVKLRDQGGIKIYGSPRVVHNGREMDGKIIYQITKPDIFIRELEQRVGIELNDVTKNLILNRIGKFNHNTSSFEADETKFFSSDHGIPGLHAEVLALDDAINFLTNGGRNLEELTKLDSVEIHIATYKLAAKKNAMRVVEKTVEPFPACLNCGIIIPEGPIVPGGPTVKVITGRKEFTEQDLEIKQVFPKAKNTIINSSDELTRASDIILASKGENGNKLFFPRDLLNKLGIPDYDNQSR